jgi:hypothetical protein
LKRTNHILQDSDRHLNSSHLSMASCGERNFSCCFQDNACQKMHAINLLSYIFFSQFSFLSVSAALIYTHTHTPWTYLQYGEACVHGPNRDQVARVVPLLRAMFVTKINLTKEQIHVIEMI